MAEKHMLAADFGGSSGRVVKGNFDGNQISLEEIHRFANEPVTLWGKETSVMCWDFLRLFCELKKGILKAGGTQTASELIPGVSIMVCLIKADNFLQIQSIIVICVPAECEEKLLHR